MIKEQLITLRLPYVDGDRIVRVFVPEHDDGEILPVIYMTDGQNLFEDMTVRFGCWYTREAVREHRSKHGRAAIIVGIHNDCGEIERTTELMPMSIGRIELPSIIPDEEKPLHIPRGEIFEDFILNTVMPAVEKNFPVKKGRSNTAFCGSSSGGLESFYIALNNPEKFGAAGVLSPALLFYNSVDLEKWIKVKSNANDLPFLYMYIGGGDDLEKILTPSYISTIEILKKYYPADKIKEVTIGESKHNESAWAPIFKDFLSIFLSE